jgi:hypothetical protein
MPSMKDVINDSKYQLKDMPNDDDINMNSDEEDKPMEDLTMISEYNT